MLVSTPIMKSNNFQSNSQKSLINANCNALKSHHDTFNRNSNISFGAWDDGDYSHYGNQEELRERRRFKVSPEDDKNLSCKVQLTPENIEHIIRTAPSKDAGILTSYEKLSEESKKVGLGTKSMVSILEGFAAARDRKDWREPARTIFERSSYAARW